MKSYKIAVIGLKGLPAFGGAATVGENLIHELKDNFRFTVYAVSSHTHREGLHDGYEQIVFKKFFIRKLNILYYYIRSAIHCVFMRRYDLIHLHHVDGAFIIPLLRLKYRVILTSHAQPQVNEKWPRIVKHFFTFSERIALWFANRITTVSTPLADIYRKKTTRTIHYIPNGVSVKQRIAEKVIAEENYILFAAGRIIPLKGLHILIKAMHEGNLQKKLLVIGDMEQIPSYKSEISILCEGINVEFIPLIREKPLLLRYVQRADYFVFPSYSENMSLMLLEAALVKTPVICSDIPANTVIFNENEVTFFRVNNHLDLLEKLIYADKNPDKLKEKAEAAFQKLITEYDWSNIALQYKALYDGLLVEKQKGHC
jgi:glycosyltransferase involved in cell wall biosynthesis